MTETDAIGLLSQLLNEGRALEYGAGDSDHFRQRGFMILRRIFGDDSPYVALWTGIVVRPAAMSFDPDRNTALHREAWESAKKQRLNLLSTAVEELTTFGPKDMPIVGRRSEVTSRRVFVVHGHDEGLKQSVARLLECLDLDAIILHEQPNRSRALIEKFEAYSEVAFAVVLLTPDDMAYKRGEKPDTATPRARQNVVFELGFFIGRLGRENVAALLAGDEIFEPPSDYDGVTYIQVDASGKWKYDLATELQAAGIDVDKNKIS